jgi:hypothetical protein
MRKTSLTMAGLLLLAAGTAGAQNLQHELLIFGSAEVARTPGVDEETATDIEPEKVAADILFSLQSNSFKAFGEYLLTNHEADLERLQFGWEPSDHQVVWLGRFHQASSVWNHEHHHGQFLQTSVSRPASEQWEDDGGIIPQHFLGLLWESGWSIGGAYRLKSAIGAGLAPIITPKGLEPFDVLHADASGHKLGVQARIAYQPDEMQESGIGLLIGRNEIGAEHSPQSALGPFDHVDQTVIGLYAKGEWGPWKAQLTGYQVSASLEGIAGAPRQDFFTGYVQVERDLPKGFELFARHENTADATDNLYLQMFPKFVIRRSALGGRWQFARSHALTLEIATADSRNDSYMEYRLQWSAALL